MIDWLLEGINWRDVIVAVVASATVLAIIGETIRIVREKRDKRTVDEIEADLQVHVAMEHVDDEYKRLVREST